MDSTKYLKLILFAFLFTLPGHAGWESSGGELFRFSHNPWFVKNTSTVKYCVEVDEATVSVTRSEIAELIRHAITYWKFELNYHSRPGSSRGFARLGTQDFQLQSNCTNVDLAFKIGFGALAQDEIDYLEESDQETEPENRLGVKRFVGVTIRKTYDHETLKGRGTIFIASDIGPNSYHNPGHLITNAWRHKKLMLYALLHELGHVFGVPHTGTGIMSEVFLDQLLHQRFSQFYLREGVQSFLSPVGNFKVCSNNGFFNPKFFGLENTAKCMIFERVRPDRLSWNISAQNRADNFVFPVGKMTITSTTNREDGAKPAVVVHLPPEQRVFRVQDRLINSFMIGPTFANFGARGHFERMNSRKPYPFYMDLQTDSITMVSLAVKPGSDENSEMVRDYEARPVLNYAPPSLMHSLIPIEF